VAWNRNSRQQNQSRVAEGEKVKEVRSGCGSTTTG
jgi:hypothetical protein